MQSTTPQDGEEVWSPPLAPYIVFVVVVMKSPYIPPPKGEIQGNPPNHWVRGGGGHISSRAQWIPKLTVTHTRVELLKELPNYERVVGTSSVYLKKKNKPLFLRDEISS